MLNRLLLLLTLILLASCGRQHGEATALLDRADSLMTVNADSAYNLLVDVQDEARASWRRADRMRYELTLAEAMNKTYQDFTTDSVMKIVVRYYDRHGSANQQLKAHYLLGCAYRDMGEAPAAINTWQEAVDCADTTSTDCDYNTLYLVYGQMAELFHKRLLFSDEIQSHILATRYALLAQDTLNALFFQAKMGSTYILINKQDSAECILKNTLATYERHDFIQQSFAAVSPLIYLYVHQPDHLAEAKQLMDKYEALSNDFNEHHELPPSKRQYYYYRGMYYEQLGQLDSAERCYRKVYSPGMDYVSKDPMYKGLLSVFTKRHQADSIAKYARLYGEANDSSIAIRDRELTAQMAATYNYSRAQEETLRQTKKAARISLWLVVTIAISIIISITAISIRLRYKRRQKAKQEELAHLRKEFQDTRERLEKENKSLSKLSKARQNVISLIQTELNSLAEKSRSYQVELMEAQHNYSHINKQYDELVQIHKTEKEQLEAKIEELKRESSINAELACAQQFNASAIVEKIKHNATKSDYTLDEEDWHLLREAICTCYPRLMANIQSTFANKPLAIQACMFVILKLRETDIANFMGISKQYVSNLKREINLLLFNEDSGRTLYRNLEQHYGLFS